jgi:hypothetical protein
MPQVHAYIPDEVAKRMTEDARAKGISTSQIIARLIRKEYGGGWPEGYHQRFFGSWKGEPLERPDQGEYPVREEIDWGK